MPKYSIIVPVFNRPDEVDELLNSLSLQSNKDFEVIIVEDGSNISSESIISKFKSTFNLKYFFKENTGQGFSRNFGSKHAVGDWLIFFDSDCVVPPNYLENLEILVMKEQADAFCGPDSAREDFSDLQKAISYSMTSFLTTGGIRGGNKKVDNEAHLRSYNLVMKSNVFDSLGGFAKTNMGEDMELSNRFKLSGHIALISQKLEVHHKRRNSIKSFFKQVSSFGRTRIQLKRSYQIPIKVVHLFPTFFTIGFFGAVAGLLILPQYASLILGMYAVYSFMIFSHATSTNKSIKVGMLAVVTSFVQHFGYGLGFMQELVFPKGS